MGEHINLMPFHYVQDVYQKNQLGTRLDKRHIIPEVNIISGKASVATINGAGGTGEGALNASAEPTKNSLGSKEHLDRLKIDLNAAEIIIFQGYKRTKNYCKWEYTYAVLKLRVKQVTYESKM